MRRDFTDVRDVVHAYTLLMEKGRSGEVYNVSSGKAVQLQEILDLLLSFAKERIKVEVDSQKVRRVDIPLLVGNNHKIRKETSWEPKIPLAQSLQDLLEYWRNNI
jgi:GDP-4-dehydro-6-deoxy-D-mannose reductase